MTRERIATLGERGRLVRVMREPYARAPKGERVRVQWTDARTGKLRTHSFADAAPATVKAARRLAEDMAVKLRGPDGNGPAPVTLGELWRQYEAAEFAHLRPLTQRNYRLQWRMAVDVLGERTRADTLRHADLDTLRKAYREGRAGGPLEHRTVREAIATLKHVVRWGVASERIARDRLSSWRYKIAKEEAPTTPPEYSAAEFAAILSVLNPHRRDQWRAWVALTIAGTQGARANSVLHLQWADVDDAAGVVTWRAAYDKMGREWTQPLRPVTIIALAVAFRYRTADAYEGPWVFYRGHAGSKQETWTYDALYAALRTAERRAGVTHRDRRAIHSARRMVAGDLAAVTGDAILAMQAIGDRDPRMAQRYVQKRDQRVTDAFGKLDAAVPTSVQQTVNPQPKRNRRKAPDVARPQHTEPQ